ncbi:MAG TPA: GtrA family protein [Paludibacter sp.]|nr:GtrA family protein [Paludibacter sp.]
MRKKFISIGRRICCIIDFFYPPFRKYTTLQFFRYGFTGAANVGFSLVLYFLVYNFVLRQQVLPLGFFTFSSHIGTLVITFPVSTFFGFLLQKYVTFTESDLRGHVQLYRYFIVAFANLGVNAFFLKILVDGFHFWTTPSQVVATFFCILISYFSQKKYTFKAPKKHKNPIKGHK